MTPEVGTGQFQLCILSPPPSAGAYTAVGTETGANAGAKANGEWFGVDIDVEINVKWVDNNSKIDPQMR